MKQILSDEDTLKLEAFLEKCFGSKYYEYLDNLDYQAIINEDYMKVCCMNHNERKNFLKDRIDHKILNKVHDHRDHDRLDSNLTPYFNKTALYFACENKNLEMIDILLKGGANPILVTANIFPFPPIHRDAIMNHKILEIFIQNKLDIDTINAIFKYAISYGGMKSVELLLEQKNLNVTNDELNTIIAYLKETIEGKQRKIEETQLRIANIQEGRAASFVREFLQCIERFQGNIEINQQMINLLQNHLESRQPNASLSNAEINPANQENNLVHNQI